MFLEFLAKKKKNAVRDFLFFIFFKYYLLSFLEKRKENRDESSLLLRVCLARGYTLLIKVFFFPKKKIHYLITNLVLIFKK